MSRLLLAFIPWLTVITFILIMGVVGGIETAP